MDFLKKLFTPAPPRDFPAELAAINKKIEAQPGNLADYDKRSDIHFRMGSKEAAIMDFEAATLLEPDNELKELRLLELDEMKKKFKAGKLEA